MTTPATRPLLGATNIQVGYDGSPVIENLSIAIPDARITVIVGANACGKSTLLKTLSRLIQPRSGTVTLGERDISQIAGKELARMIGLLPQHPVSPEGITVADLVGRGRYPHQGFIGRWTAEDDRIVADALHATDTANLASRRVDELSGGQRQRVWIAMALAQRTDILLLDEPTTFLDLTHQLDVLDLLTELNTRHSTTVVMVLHDLNLAARYADHLVVMREGRIVCEGEPRAILTAETVRDAFDLDCLVIDDPVTGSPLVVPHSKHAQRTPTIHQPHNLEPNE